jgi:hypothetical protein
METARMREHVLHPLAAVCDKYLQDGGQVNAPLGSRDALTRLAPGRHGPIGNAIAAPGDPLEGLGESVLRLTQAFTRPVD